MARKPKGYWADKIGMTPADDSVEYQRRWKQLNPGAYKEWKYGLTEEQYQKMLLSQYYRCGICLTDKPGGRHSAWQIDHDHWTGEVRGLLCWACNAGLGQFKDNPDALRCAADWVELSRNKKKDD